MSATLTDRIDALLPQTQCRQCGYPGCRPYAEALAAGRADINQCPPGGEDTIEELAQLLGVPRKKLDPALGPAKPAAVAVIDEKLCIGCTLCIQACPVDAIVGAAKLMHTVLAAECTGCELCIPPCPVDCIAMVESGKTLTPAEPRECAARYRRRYRARMGRIERERAERAVRHGGAQDNAAERRKRATIEKAMERARQRLQQRRAKPE
jgi:Na+-translocating ferredoxin:NAD+ oxidoreductase subunit B